jgi:hypothetical protein
MEISNWLKLLFCILFAESEYWNLVYVRFTADRLCGLVVRVPVFQLPTYQMEKDKDKGQSRLTFNLLRNK